MKALPFIFVLLILISWQCSVRPPAPSAVNNEVTTIFLVRHAEKATDDPSDPNLTQAGHMRAQRLAEMLAWAEVDAIFSTPYRRTQQTAGPLAVENQLTIQEYDPRDGDFARRLLQEEVGKTILVVGHSNSTPALVNALLGEQRFRQLDESEYDKLFIVQKIGSRVTPILLSY